MAEIARELLHVNLEDEMKQSYLDYAMSVIVGRALPDVRDGLKPVHRRVLYAHARARQRVEQVLQEVRPRGRRRHGQATTRTATRPSTTRSSAWRSRSRCATCWSTARATSAPWTATRPRRCATPSPHVAPRRRAAGRHRQGNGRLRAELRRVRDRADGAADARPEPAGQRLVGHRGRHGHQHSRRTTCVEIIDACVALHRQAGDHDPRVNGAHSGT